jgi:hypothetical protein
MNAKLKVIPALALALVAAACQSNGTATTAPGTGAPSTAAPATAAPLPTVPASVGIPTAAVAVFQPKAGSSTTIQGGATLVGAAGQTEVVIAVTASPDATFAAAIQKGTCDNLTPEIAYRLTDVVSGASATTVAVDVATLLATPHAINIIVAGSETESSLSCGAITAAPTP